MTDDSTRRPTGSPACPDARARSSRSTSATPRAPTSAAAAPRTRRTSSSRRAPSRRRAARSNARAAPSCSRSRARSRSSSAPPPGACPWTRRWDHVAWVTAANDLGLYDLRANDKGSNVRSKGGDGFTPVGPGLLDARAVDPAALRLRTWVNGELRQDDTTAGLLFPLPQLVADLSQHLTLEPGDVILTGTPAGSSVVVPGRRRRGRGRRAGRARAPTSGRLVTTVVQGEHGFDGALGSLPAVDDVQRAEAWGVRTPAPGVRLTAELREKLLRAPVAGLSAQLRKRGLNDVTIDGVRPMHPGRQARRHRAHAAVRAGPRGPVRPPRRRLQRPEARVRHRRRGRGHRHRGARRDRVRHARRHPRPARPRARRGRHRHRRRRPRPRRRRRRRHPRLLRRARTPPCSAAGTCRGTSTSPSRAAGRPSSPATSSSATGTASSSSRPRWSRRSSTPPSPRRRRTAGSREQVAAGHPVDGLFPMDARWRARFDAWRASR